MTETYFPFDGGTGANVTEANWYDMATAWQSSGIKYGDGSQLIVSATSGMVISVGTGAAWTFGGFYRNSAAKSLTVGSNVSGNTRIDTVVLNLDLTANTIVAQIHVGTPSGSPVPPTLGALEFPLADITVANGAANIVAGNITNRRTFYQTELAVPYTPTFGVGSGATFTVTPITGNAYPDNDNAIFRVLPGNLCFVQVNQLLTWSGTGNTAAVTCSLPFAPRYAAQVAGGAQNTISSAILSGTSGKFEVTPSSNNGNSGNWYNGNFWLRFVGTYQMATI